MSHELLVFLHIPKTAGTTLRWFLESHYPSRAVLRCYGSKGCGREQLAVMDETRKRRIALLSSHHPYGLHEVFPQPATYITMLREPLDRVLSAYFAFQQTPDLRGLRQFTYRLEEDHRDNRQVRLLASVPADAAVTGDHLEVAKRRLELFTAVGLTERFTTSLALLRKALRLERSIYVTRNVTQSRPVADDVSPEMRRAILSANELDAALYAHADGLFRDQCDGHDVREDDVADIRRPGILGTAGLYTTRALRRLAHPLQR